MALNPRTTPENVELVFRDIGLVICDDQALVVQKINARKNYWRRKTTGANPAEALEGKFYFEVGTDMEKKLKEVVDLLYAKRFLVLAQASVQMGYASGERVMTPGLHEAIRNIVKTICLIGTPGLQSPPQWKLDFDWVEKAQKNGDLPPDGGAIVEKPLLEQWKARSEVNRIVLTWKPPTQNCDRIKVRRVELNPPGKPNPKRQEFSLLPAQGLYVDNNVTAGVIYEYAACAMYHDEEGSWSAVEQARPLMDVASLQLKAVDGGRVELSWDLPYPDVEIVVFHQVGRPPSVKQASGTLIPQPQDPNTKSAYIGSASRWTDDQSKEGEEYGYLVVAVYGREGLSTAGRTCSIKVPKHPPSVSQVSARTVTVGNRVIVRLEWPPLSDKSVSYTVLRSEGSTPPVNPADKSARIEDEVRAHAYDDMKNIVVGRRYTYAVFTQLKYQDQLLYSRAGTPSNSVDVLAEVANLDVSTGNGCVELHWNQPPTVHCVTVRRMAEQEPSKYNGNGDPITGFVGIGHVRDNAVQNGVRYVYRVCCIYRPEPGQEVCTPGLTIEGTAMELPEMVGDFEGHQDGVYAAFSWTPPAKGQARVLRSAAHSPKRPGERFKTRELTGLGEDCVVRAAPQDGRERATDQKPDFRLPWYSIYSIAGSHAVAGRSVQVSVVRDVSGLRAVQRQGRAVLTWNWPDECSSVLVARREGTWPAGHDDALAARTRCTCNEYEQMGRRFSESIPGGKKMLFYVVYAEIAGNAGGPHCYAQGKTADCRAQLPWNAHARLSYELTAGKNGKLNITWRLINAPADFAGFMLLAGQTSVPSTPEDDALRLFEWKPGGAAPADSAVVSLKPVRDRRWATFFAKIVVTDPAQRSATVVTYPNTTIPFSAKGAAILPRRPRNMPTFRHGVPRKVRCPICLEEFDVEKVLFAKPGADPRDPNANLQRAHFPWYYPIRKALWGPKITQPTDGRYFCTEKFCPGINGEKHKLPSTADHQNSLIIALLGATSSGKTTYMASLIQALETSVARDFGTSLIHANEETNNNKKHLLSELFIKKQIFDATPGGTAHPPLVFDLGVPGDGWGEQNTRNVSILLHDTAGENTVDEQNVEHWMPYLKSASGLIVLLDPTDIEEVNSLRGGSNPVRTGRARPIDIIGAIQNHLPPDRDLPVAIAFSKADILRDLGFIDAARIWNMDESHKQRFNGLLHDDMAGMMAELIMQWYPSAYSGFKQRFPTHAFFGVSATGCSPVNNYYPYVCPWRVEDPLLWILSQLKVLPSED